MQKRVRRVKGVSIKNKKEYWKCNILENIRPLILPCGQPFQEKLLLCRKQCAQERTISPHSRLFFLLNETIKFIVYLEPRLSG